MRKYFAIYKEAVTHIWLCTWSLWISFLFYFYQCMASQVSHLVSPCRLSGRSLGGCHIRSRWLAKWLEYRVCMCKLLWPEFTNYPWLNQNIITFNQSIRMHCWQKINNNQKLISIYINLPIPRKVSNGFGSKYTYDAYLFQCYKVLFCLFESPPPSICLRGLVIFRTIRFLPSQYSVLQYFNKNTVDLSVNGMNTLKVMYNGKLCGV